MTTQQALFIAACDTCHKSAHGLTREGLDWWNREHAHADSVPAAAALIQPEPYKIRARILDVLKDVKHEAWKTGRDGSCEESFGEVRARARFDEALDALVALALGGAS